MRLQIKSQLQHTQCSQVWFLVYAFFECFCIKSCLILKTEIDLNSYHSNSLCVCTVPHIQQNKLSPKKVQTESSYFHQNLRFHDGEGQG